MLHLKRVEQIEREKLRMGFWWRASRLEKVEPRSESPFCHRAISFVQYIYPEHLSQVSSCSRCWEYQDGGKRSSPAILELTAWSGRQTNEQLQCHLTSVLQGCGNVRDANQTDLGQLTEEVLEKRSSVTSWRQQIYEPVFLAKWIRQHKSIKLFERMCADIIPASVFLPTCPPFPDSECPTCPNSYSFWLLTGMSPCGRKPSLTPM